MTSMHGAALVALAVLTLASPREASADTRESAREAYDRGAAAYDSGDYPRAAIELARADELFANDVALELAIKAAVKADDPRLAMTLAARGSRRASAGVAAAAEAAKTKMAGRTGTLIVMCPGRASCAATIDGEDVRAGAPHVVLVGEHRVLVEGGGGPREQLVARVSADAVTEVKGAPPSGVLGNGAGAVPVLPPPRASDERPASSASSHGHGLSPTWFWIGLGVTAALNAGAIASAVDTQGKREDFRQSPSSELQERGLDAQLRTNLLAGGTGFVGVATAVVGIFFTGWSSSAASEATHATTNGRAATVRSSAGR